MERKQPHLADPFLGNKRATVLRMDLDTRLVATARLCPGIPKMAGNPGNVSCYLIMVTLVIIPGSIHLLD